MTETKIPDFTDNGLWISRSTLAQRYGKEAKFELADAELRLDPESFSLALCPTVFWAERSANFVLSKVGESAYRCSSTIAATSSLARNGKPMTTLSNAVITLLQVQAVHERQKTQSGATGVDAPRSN